MRWICVNLADNVVGGNIDFEPPDLNGTPGYIWIPYEGENEEEISPWTWWYHNGTFVNEDPKETLQVVKDAKYFELRLKCAEMIVIPSFTSEALGSIHNYDCREIDQINLKMRYDIASYTGNPEPLWASDGTRFMWKNHTAEEIMQVMIAMNAHIKINQNKLANKLAQIEACTTKDAVRAITW